MGASDDFFHANASIVKERLKSLVSEGAMLCAVFFSISAIFHPVRQRWLDREPLAGHTPRTLSKVSLLEELSMEGAPEIE